MGRITPPQLSQARASGAFAAVKGSGTARFVKRAQSGEDLAITCVGDSILEGQTVTTPATDGAMILLAADLSTRFGVTVTQTNHADSGYTAARAFINGNVSAAIADDADLYIVSAFDKNDLGQDINGQWAPGYPLARSTAAVERMVRAIRTDVPKADIIIMSTNPYVSGSASNPYQQAKDEAARRVAAAYGCEWVDVYQAFIDEGDYSGLMTDSTHPNTAGHRLIADTILEHLEDKPNLAAAAPGAVSAYGLYDPERVDPVVGEYGYGLIAAPGTSGGVTYTTGGSGWASEVTTTVGDYVEVSADAIELLIQLSTTVEDAPVVDIAIDTVTVAEDVDMSAQGKNGAYWVPFAVDLAPGTTHTARLTLVSGTLRTYAVAALLSGVAEFRPETRLVDLGSGVGGTLDSGGAYTNHISTTLTLPSGWTAAIVQFQGYMNNRITATTTTQRAINYNVVLGSTTYNNVSAMFPATTVELRTVDPINFAVEITGSDTLLLRSRVTSTDKDKALNGGYALQAVLTRTA